MNNNKTTNILLGILIVVLVVIGIIIVVNQKQNPSTKGIVNDFPVIDSQNQSSEQVRFNSNQQAPTQAVSKNINWKSVSISTIENLAKKSNLLMEGDLRLSTESYDLTGDGSIEGIYSFPSGNSDTTIIALANSDGSTSLAKMKEKNGSIGIVGLYSVGRVSHSISYKFLPNERGFYVISKDLDENADNSEFSHLICGSNGVSAYQWNPKTNIFEYSTALTERYTAIECK